MSKGPRKKTLTLDELYDRLPRVKCKGLCGREACFEAVTVAQPEIERVRHAAGGTIPSAPNGACPFLDWNGQCSIYEDRPFVCRIYGAEPENPVKETWTCPHGCEIEGPELSVWELAELLNRAGMFDGAARSTNAEVNLELERHDAISWRWEGDDLMIMQKEEDSAR